MSAISKVVFNRWQARGLVRYQVVLTHADRSTRTLEDVDHADLIAEIGEDVVDQIDRRKCNKGTIMLGPDTAPQHRDTPRSTRVRVEVTLRRDNPREQAVIAMVDAHPAYGRRSALLRDCMVKGFASLRQEAVRLAETGDAPQIPDIFAARNHRLLGMYIEAQKAQRGQSTQHPPFMMTKTASAISPVSLCGSIERADERGKADADPSVDDSPKNGRES